MLHALMPSQHWMTMSGASSVLREVTLRLGILSAGLLHPELARRGRTGASPEGGTRSKTLGIQIVIGPTFREVPWAPVTSSKLKQSKGSRKSELPSALALILTVPGLRPCRCMCQNQGPCCWLWFSYWIHSILTEPLQLRKSRLVLRSALGTRKRSGVGSAAVYIFASNLGSCFGSSYVFSSEDYCYGDI